MQTSGPIVIAGFMGCGKTAVANALAVRLNCRMIDLDEAITQREMRSPAAIIEQDGEAAFRAIEIIVLHDVLQDGSAGVIALGGGAWINDDNRELIYQYAKLTVWIDTRFDVCWKRISLSDAVRPLGSSEEQARKLYERRRPVYELADFRLEADEATGLDDLARQIEAQVGRPRVT